MVREKLTKRVIESATKRWTTDLEIPGYMLEVRNGKRILWLKYPTGEKRQATEKRKAYWIARWIRIGEHGQPWRPDPETGLARTLTAELARDEARRLRGYVVDGQDPAARRDELRSTPTLAAFWPRYLRDHAEAHKGAATVAGDVRSMERVILPALGGTRLDRIDAGAVAKLHAARSSTPTGANRCLALLSHVFTMALSWGVLPRGTANPCEGIQRYPETRRKRFLSADELGRLGEALEEGEARWMARKAVPYRDREEDERAVSPVAILAIKLLLYSGARASEILGLRWTDLRLDIGLVMRPRKGSGEEVMGIHLPPQAVALLKDRRPLKGNPYVIVGRRRGRHLTLFGLEGEWQKVRAMAGLQDAKLHDLRHSFASVAIQGGASLYVTGGLLGHKNASTTERYTHLGAQHLSDAAGRTASIIETALKKRPLS